MLNVYLFDVPASTRGALTILEGFYEEAKAAGDISWKFILSTSRIPETRNIKIENFPWIKKSWLHRLFFDHVIAPSLVRAGKPEAIVSLQNVCVPCRSITQILYVQQSIPFSPIHFSLIKNPREWIYQNILSIGICHSIKCADAVVVQTQWMKEAIVSRTGISPDKILVTRPQCSICIKKHYRDTTQTRKTFFYPAPLISYKNHGVIVEAAKHLISKGMTDFRIIFTINEIEAEKTEIGKMKQIDCIGSIPHEKVMEYYSQTVLLFPSTLESFGLPLLEGGLSKTRILASDMPFSHEVLKGYENVTFFQPESPEELADIMEATINGWIEYSAESDDWYDKDPVYTGWQPVLELLRQPDMIQKR